MGEIETEVLKLDKTKASQKIRYSYYNYQRKIIFVQEHKSAIKSASFPSSLKLADVASLHREGRKYMEVSFRLVSILPMLSKIFEKCTFA